MTATAVLAPEVEVKKIPAEMACQAASAVVPAMEMELKLRPIATA
ncbi:hypothetical protein A2U01_0032859, partial [Trifolium medium]|nr:hypothetical protein [Trifolium medium]